MGNDIAGGKVDPVPEVVDSPILESKPDDLAQKHPNVFPVSVLTRAQARKQVQNINLSNSVFASALSEDVMSSTDGADDCAVQPVETKGEPSPPPLPLTCEALIKAQESDPSLVKCFDAVNDNERRGSQSFIIQDGMLMRRWASHPGKKLRNGALYTKLLSLLVLGNTYWSWHMSTCGLVIWGSQKLRIGS